MRVTVCCHVHSNQTLFVAIADTLMCNVMFGLGLVYLCINKVTLCSSAAAGFACAHVPVHLDVVRHKRHVQRHMHDMRCAEGILLPSTLQKQFRVAVD